MLVIEGKIGKSLKLQEVLLKEIDNNSLIQILMIDTVGINHININHLFQIKTSLDTIRTSNFISSRINELRRYNLIVFETNDKKEMIDSYKRLESLIGRKCIVTIQNNDLEDINVYEIE